MNNACHGEKYLGMYKLIQTLYLKNILYEILIIQIIHLKLSFKDRFYNKSTKSEISYSSNYIKKKRYLNMMSKLSK